MDRSIQKLLAEKNNLTEKLKDDKINEEVKTTYTREEESAECRKMIKAILEALKERRIFPDQAIVDEFEEYNRYVEEKKAEVKKELDIK